MMKAYKMLDHDFKCRDFQYEVGKTYEHKGDIELCGSGFHACLEAIDCAKFYELLQWNRYAEVELLGETKKDDTKIVTNKIRIVKELTFSEFLGVIKEQSGEEI